MSLDDEGAGVEAVVGVGMECATFRFFPVSVVSYSSESMLCDELFAIRFLYSARRFLDSIFCVLVVDVFMGKL